MDNIELRWVWRSGTKVLQYRTLFAEGWTPWVNVPLVEGE